MEKKNFSIAGATEISVGEKANIQNVLYTDKALYFSNADGVCFRLTNNGTNGWRMQATANGFDAFDDNGASQALAHFLGETVNDATAPIEVKKVCRALKATAADGTSVSLSLSEKFNLKICMADGKVATELTSVVADADTVLMKGALEKNEAIYGGGERLDKINKRGTKFDLYICDGWNEPTTTYMAIPLFINSRGCGMFVNRYEPSKVDFGCDEKNTWSYLHEGKLLDCYFYATGKAEDVLASYTELSGHAYMPAPWIQGIQICRYGPDYWRFEQDRCHESLKEIPNWDKLFVKIGEDYVPTTVATEEQLKNNPYLYRFENDQYVGTFTRHERGAYYLGIEEYGMPRGDSCKTIMTKFMNAGMKPTAASMEARGWEGCFEDNEKGRANKEDLYASYKWLHENDLHAMVYIRAGGVHVGMEGFKEEYLLHADIEVENDDGTVTVMENHPEIPWLCGTGKNPDAGFNGGGKLITWNYLDITNDEAVEWYFDKIWGDMIAHGIDGVKIDFCEEVPDDGRQYGKVTTHYRWKNPDRVPVGCEHQFYPTFFISAFYKRMVELKESHGLYDGFMVLNRGGGIGSQRNPYMWAGDQCRSYEKIEEQAKAVINSGISGVPFMSYDMAGYVYGGEVGAYFKTPVEKESAIFARAIEFTSFTTNIQTHGQVRHAYEMTEDVQQIYRNFTGVHFDLMDYIQKYSRLASEKGIPPVRPLALKYMSDVKVHEIEDECMLGDAILIAPIFTEDTFQRKVYLPAGSWTNLLTNEVIEGGKTVTVKVNLGQIAVFLDNNSPDAEELKKVFDGKNWKAIQAWK